jgi:uncharacterized protein (TIGR03067 family)
MRRYVPLALALAVTASLAAADPADPENPEGVWVVVSIELNGKKLSAEELKMYPDRLQLKDGKFIRFKGDMAVVSGAYKVDTGLTPHTITFIHDAGPLKDRALLGIYEIKGDRMRSCYDMEGKARPTAFATEGKPGFLLSEYKRGK